MSIRSKNKARVYLLDAFYYQITLMINDVISFLVSFYLVRCQAEWESWEWGDKERRQVILPIQITIPKYSTRRSFLR